MSNVLGMNAKLLRGVAGATAATEVRNVKDLTLNLESGEADVTTRATGGWKSYVQTTRDASVEFGMVYDTEDEDCIAFRGAYLSGTPLALFITDGGGSGLDADFAITGFNIDQSLEEASTISVTAKPTLSDRAPVWKDKQ